MMTAAMQMIHWTTQKKCKCGKLLQVHYEKCGHYEARQIEADGGYFKTTRRWPNYIYCQACDRRHELANFKKEEK